MGNFRESTHFTKVRFRERSVLNVNANIYCEMYAIYWVSERDLVAQVGLGFGIRMLVDVED